MATPKKSIAIFYLAFGALLQVAMFLSTPGYYWGALVSVLFSAMLCSVLSQRSNKILFLGAYAVVALGSLVLGISKSDVDTRITIFVGALIISLVTCLLLIVTEADAA